MKTKWLDLKTTVVRFENHSGFTGLGEGGGGGGGYIGLGFEITVVKLETTVPEFENHSSYI